VLNIGNCSFTVYHFSMDTFPLLPYIQRNLSVIIFLVLAVGGMFAVYGYFSPEGVSESVQAVTTTGDRLTLSAPISKPISGREVSQRFAQSTPPLAVALIVGHQGSDSGAVCEDGLTELAINTDLAHRARDLLAAQDVDLMLFDEFDVRLTDFAGTALISIHADSCGDYGPTTTGFKVAGSSRADSAALVSCMEQAYGDATGMGIHVNTITTHMTDYHAFRKIAAGTPAIILETGFMLLDREMLTTNADIPAKGIAEGILCFLGK